MNLGDLSGVLAVEHGVTPGEMDDLLLEQVDSLACGVIDVTAMFRLEEVLLPELTRGGEKALREAIAEVFA